MDTGLLTRDRMYKCDACPAKAQVRLLGDWVTHLDLCAHHARIAIELTPNVILLEDKRGILV